MTLLPAFPEEVATAPADWAVAGPSPDSWKPPAFRAPHLGLLPAEAEGCFNVAPGQAAGWDSKAGMSKREAGMSGTCGSR